MRTLITGVNGFAGSHLADLLLTEPAVEIFGSVYGGCDNIVHLDGRVTFIEGDLRDPEFAESLFRRVQPDRIYHLAGQAFPPASWQDPWSTLEINLRAELNLLESVTRAQSPARILVVGSLEEYGRVDPSAGPLTEETPLRPDSPYAVSKIAQDYLGLQYFLGRNLHVVRVRPSNHIGPRQSENFVTSSFAKQIAEIEAELQEPVLYVGNLEASRDFTDVRDMVRAYVLALERGAPGEVYNIASGRAWSIQQVLDQMLQQARREIRVRQDPTRLRPSDSPALYASAAKFRALTGWHPTIPLDRSLHDILEYWREKTASRKKG